MAKCTDKERELIDSYLTNGQYVDPKIYEAVLEEKISKELKNKLKHALITSNVARAKLEEIRNEFYSICPDTAMQSLVLKIESEAIDLK